MISLEYLVFLFATVIIYYFTSFRYRKWVIFFSSILFLGFLSPPFLFIAMTLASINFFSGLITEKQSSARIKIRIFQATVLINILVLAYFKFVNFFIDDLNILYKHFSIQGKFQHSSILLPIGISYYTFQNIGYIYRVSKDMEKSEKNFIVYIIYSLFFPKLLSGPIEKSNSFLPQLQKEVKYNNKNITTGLQLILSGLFKKVVIANNIGIYINTIYADPGVYRGIILVIGFFLQLIYLYFDFSGYTDIALGAGRLFGFRLTNNFNRPFFATNVSNYWRRWHISLTSWCNEFIFLPILFNKRRWGIWGAVFAVFTTFLVVGLWHGPRWNFIILGLLQGIAINYEFFTRNIRINIASRFPVSLVNILSRFLTYLFMSLTLIFFFSPKFSDVLIFISNMFQHSEAPFDVLNQIIPDHTGLLLALASTFIILFIEGREENGKLLKESYFSKNKWIRWSVYFVMISLIILYHYGDNTFIYAQF